MILMRSQRQRLLRALEALGPVEFTTKDAYGLGAPLHMTPLAVRKALSALEKTDALVRMCHGIYVTMATFRTYNSISSGPSASGSCS